MEVPSRKSTHAGSIRAATCDDPHGLIWVPIPGQGEELEDGVRLPCHASQRRQFIALGGEVTTITTMAVLLASCGQSVGPKQRQKCHGSPQCGVESFLLPSRLGGRYDSKGAHREPAAGLSIPISV